nr:hypothetical protein BaRGS_007972 [Batillaria attramentaria]
MEEFAHYLAGELGLTQNGTPAHGIGVASLSVVLHELFKLLHLARCSDVTLLRIGTCGGIGVEEGTVIISDGALNSQLRPVYTWYSLGQARERPVVVDAELARELQACAKHGDHFPTVVGKTFCADDFYEAQGRLDGAVCEFSGEDKQKFMERLWTLGVRNIEMESAGLFSLCHAVGINVPDCAALTSFDWSLGFGTMKDSMG